jgi:tRNA threonylcarbamoyladenosine biosynthesis protein TsaE
MNRHQSSAGATTDVLDLYSDGPEATHGLGRSLGPHLAQGDVIALMGTLGAGKTVFAQGIAAGLGVDEGVTSPTFTLINEYVGRLPLYHVDLYRLAGPIDAGAIGLEEYLGGDGVALVEWPERAPALLPDDHLVVALCPGTTPDSRSIQVTATGERHRHLLAALRGVQGSGQGSSGAPAPGGQPREER